MKAHSLISPENKVIESGKNRPMEIDTNKETYSQKSVGHTTVQDYKALTTIPPQQPPHNPTLKKKQSMYQTQIWLIQK